MSRGFGKIEKRILLVAMICQERGVTLRDMTFYIQGFTEHNFVNSSLYKSISRAARTLEKKGLVESSQVFYFGKTILGKNHGKLIRLVKR